MAQTPWRFRSQETELVELGTRAGYDLAAEDWSVSSDMLAATLASRVRAWVEVR